MKVIVLMSTYNGEKFIREQLDSLINQDLMPYKIIIRDDGSKDETINILEEYSSNYSFIEYYYGENKGTARSNWELINKCEKADYYALCDQDDVWFKDKLQVAVDTLEKQGKGPLLYCGRFTLTDESLNPLNSDISKLYSYTDFPHSLIYQTSPGCTMVFNDAARKKIVEYDIENNYCMIHDSIIHKIVAMFGTVVLDETSHMYYRQHGSNQIGLTANKVKTFFGRIEHFLSGRIKNTRSDIAKALLDVYGEQLDKDKYELLNIVANYRNDKELKNKFLKEPRFLTGTSNDKFFKLLIRSDYI